MVLALHCQVCSLSNRGCLTDDPSSACMSECTRRVANICGRCWRRLVDPWGRILCALPGRARHDSPCGDEADFHVESPPAFCTMAAQLRFLQFCFEGLNGFRGPMAPSTLPATSRPYIESGVSWKLSRVPCTLPV